MIRKTDRFLKRRARVWQRGLPKRTTASLAHNRARGNQAVEHSAYAKLRDGERVRNPYRLLETQAKRRSGVGWDELLASNVVALAGNET